tara:strand:+ start:129 stop:500 length:372 start_codon:yes stop_codon:yes gene_type:complete
MSTQSIVGGTFYFFIDGVQYKARGNAKYCVHTITRKGVVGIDGPHGQMVEPKLPYIELDITDAGDLNTKRFQDMDDVTITGENANGKNCVFRNAFFTEGGEVDPQEGKLSVRFESLDAEELTV